MMPEMGHETATKLEPQGDCDCVALKARLAKLEGDTHDCIMQAGQL
jgi:hypothetical protein